ncbi:YIPF6 [Lepeophtheirus salmonis]|uniref:Protein YIPF n=1 Tax=Lepeophtheirus salmonis TaxID=72036 RepID=A0A7R8CAR5_LEPSM|nr:YIPF6 [Lepeophtheirus salmonis]CAF2751433.1 YIPF6 [Lepeophtheirus salmonis]
MDSSTPASLEIYQDETRREEDVVLSGKITTSQSYEGMRFDTLDEPVRVTLMKDINAVALKFSLCFVSPGGSFLVTFNTKLLKGKISLWQSLCVLGYCLLPLSSALLISKIAFGFVWSFYASSIFLGDSAPGKLNTIRIFMFWSNPYY